VGYGGLELAAARRGAHMNAAPTRDTARQMLSRLKTSTGRDQNIIPLGGVDNAGDRGYGLPFPISISYLHQSRSHEVTTVSA
jgi:hypothetical protein